MIGMNFIKYDVKSIDIKHAWMSTNTNKEVDIIQNIHDMFELWIGSEYIQQYNTFDIAKRNAETLVPFKVKFEV